MTKQKHNLHFFGNMHLINIGAYSFQSVKVPLDKVNFISVENNVNGVDAFRTHPKSRFIGDIQY